MNATELQKLLREGERRRVETKGPEPFSGDFRAHLAATLIALANTEDGGFLIVGVDNDRNVQGVGGEALPTFDPTCIGNYLRTRVSPAPEFIVEHVAVAATTVVVIRVAEFSDVPHLLTKDLESSNKKYGRQGDILVRSAQAETTRLQAEADFRSLIDRAIAKREAALVSIFRQIARVVGLNGGDGEQTRPPRIDNGSAVAERLVEAAGEDALWIVVYRRGPETVVAVGKVREAKDDSLLLHLLGWKDEAVPKTAFVAAERTEHSKHYRDLYLATHTWEAQGVVLHPNQRWYDRQ